MKLFLFRQLATLMAILIASPVMAGGVAGGGGPPALEHKQPGMMARLHRAWDLDEVMDAINGQGSRPASLKEDGEASPSMRPQEKRLGSNKD